ncbi:FecCD family ABC transporter permease [Achromobacter xylosoxidans]|uniref:FecCD family ABC transporter permease n=1 Tax=Alcaligenes xylosoxydans xylosoxydans TaxID=85698 RepID=UPI0006C4D03B|nr:iron chelate uptake ABC transporter family permease subunit [Achromobacter xylosoxidans]MDH0523371.1 iron chelate uptake ABC transporter family permease subunit [Achromobacter xylosoxidans]MDH0547138.1 iron chelate uptake ABC transporter family permease subunit [Achromobacter xylosoxidans]CUI76175.1 Probable siderophore transport system permease protein yfiZ precursor [Achromobacter xylosoxidans]
MTRDPRPAGIGNARPPSAWSRALLLAAACVLLLVAALASLWLGSRGLPAAAVWHALARPDDGLETLVVASRIPRTLLALLTGAALAVAGALMQALTRNPLAEPGLLGVNAGAAASIVSVALLMGGMPAHPFWAALPGALAAAVAVFLIGAGGRGLQPVRLILAGAAVNAVLFAYVQAVALLRDDLFDAYRFWAVGSLAGHSLDTVLRAAPYIGVGLLLAAALARPLNLLALGRALARALGLRAGVTRVLGLLCVAVLAAAATAAAGPIAFVGLAVPHIARRYAGPDLRWLLAYCVVLGPLLMLVADILARLLRAPAELLTGVVVAFIGAPFLLLALRGRARHLA